MHIDGVGVMMKLSILQTPVIFLLSFHYHCLQSAGYVFSIPTGGFGIIPKREGVTIFINSNFVLLSLSILHKYHDNSH